MDGVILYALSFLMLFCAEICSTLHGIFLMQGKKYLVALFGGISSVLWCIKIVVVMNNYLTIITAFAGAYLGTLTAFYIGKKLNKNLADGRKTHS